MGGQVWGVLGEAAAADVVGLGQLGRGQVGILLWPLSSRKSTPRRSSKGMSGAWICGVRPASKRGLSLELE
jgi:hypothetical protein